MRRIVCVLLCGVLSEVWGKVIRCKLNPSRIMGTTFEFSPGDSLTVNCGDDYWIMDKHTTTAVSTCQLNGTWSIVPKCLKVNCPNHRPKEVTWWQMYSNQRAYIGDQVRYQCSRGLHPTNDVGKLTCTRDGWKPDPPCQVKTCGTPEDIPNGYYDPVQDSETTIQYYCNEGFEMVSRVTTRMCFNGNWTNRVPVCEAKTCNLPPLNEAMIVSNMPEREDRVPQGHQLHFSCKLPGKVLKGSSDLVCGKDGGWGKEFPTCEETCKLTYIGDSVHLESHALGASVQVGEKVTFRCHMRGHYLLGKKEVMCQPGGTWKDPFPTCGAGAQNCFSPPMLQDGDVKESQDSEYRHMQQVEMMCQRYYIIEGGPTKTCVNGEWEGEMRCLKPCTVDRTAMNKHKIRFRYSYDNKLYSQHNDTIEFLCKDWTLPENPRRLCKDGHIELPTCM